MKMRLEEVGMDFVYERAFHHRSPEAYERLLLDALRGDQSLFSRSHDPDDAERLASVVGTQWRPLKDM